MYLLILLLNLNLAISSDNYIINEQFDGSKSLWDDFNSKICNIKIANGVMNLDMHSTSKWLNVNREIFIDPNKDFELEIKLKFVNGADNYGYGLVFGSYDYDYANYFLVTGNGNYKIYSKSIGQESEHTKWIKSNIINNKDYNILKIEKVQSNYSFYLNNKKVYENDSIKLYGTSFGISIQKKMNIDIDYFSIKQVESPINLHEDINFEIKKEFLNDEINSVHTEKSPKVSPDGNILFFTRSDKSTPDKINDSDVFYAIKDSNGIFSKVENIGKPINNSGHNSIISITSDGNTLMVMNTYKEDGSPKSSGISISRKIQNKWEIPKEVKIEDFQNFSKYSEYMLSADGNILILTVQRSFTFGMKDIYVSFKKEDGTFSKPKNLGPIVNTFTQETGAFLAPDLKTLYYSTAGFSGYGSDDIYMTKRLDESWTNWTIPVNMGNNINSPEWDAYLTLDASGEFAYMTSNREGKELDLIKLNLPPAVRPDPVCLVKGIVKDTKTGKTISANVEYKDIKTNDKLGTASSDDVSGEFKIILQRGKKYSFNAIKEGYYPISQNLDLSDIHRYQEVVVDLLLTPIEKGAEIILNNLFFDYNKADLQTDSYSELNSLVDFLNSNEGIKIEIIGHTDDQGSASYNLKLSKDRAISVMEYLSSKGISKERLSATGFGESKPMLKNDSDENRAKNRRVEFKIQ